MHSVRLSVPETCVPNLSHRLVAMQGQPRGLDVCTGSSYWWARTLWNRSSIGFTARQCSAVAAAPPLAGRATSAGNARLVDRHVRCVPGRHVFSHCHGLHPPVHTEAQTPSSHPSHKASKAIIKSRRSRVTWSHEAHCDGRALHLKISTTGASGTQASRAKRRFSFCIIITRHACPSNGNLHALMNASRRQAVAHGLDRLAGSLEQLCCAHGRLWSAPQLERQRHPRLTSIALQAT